METLVINKNLRQVPQSNPRSNKKKEGARYPPEYRSTTEQRKKQEGPPPRDTQGYHLRGGNTFKKMGKEAQAGHMPTPSDNSNNQNETRKERASREFRHTNTRSSKTKVGYLKPSRGKCQMLVQCLVPSTITSGRASKTCKKAYCSTWWKNTRKG